MSGGKRYRGAAVDVTFDPRRDGGKARPERDV